jgi:DNA-binding GntR family transcriptional regulator
MALILIVRGEKTVATLLILILLTISGMSLTDHITADLRRRLAQDEAALDLRIEALAKAYRVSTQPVRHALARLAREGLLKKSRRGRGRALAPATSTRERKPLELIRVDPSIDEIHRRLSSMAVALSLKGEETFLREESTAAQLGVSRGLAREALQRLHGEGIVEHVPRHGWRVRAFSRDDMADFLEVREVLEVRALALAWPRLERAQIAEFLAGNRPDVAKPDNRLHDYWIDLSGNRYIRRFFAQHAPFFSTLFAWEDHDRAAALQSCEQHRAILEAILGNDRERAFAALVTHIHENHPVLQRLPKKPAAS